MKHLSEGQLRAFYDGALDQNTHSQMQAHLNTCPQCAQRATRVQQRAASVSTKLSSLQPPHPEGKPVSPQIALQRFEHYHRQKKEKAMRKNPFAKRYRPAWVAAAFVLVLTLTFTVPPLRAVAENFLALFRVQTIEFVEFNPLNLPDDQTLESAAVEIERLLNEEAVFEQKGETQTVDAATARSLVAFPVRLPGALEDDVHQIDVQPGVHIAMQVDLARIRTLLEGLGYQNIALPDSLEGADVGVDIEPSVTASYGACSSQARDDCTLFIQMRSPNVTAPPELDVEQLGQLYLRMLGMTAREAARFSKNIDWTTTLVVPIPSDQTKYEDVAVDGVMGTFIQARNQKQSPEYALMWLKDDVVYALIGSGNKSSALDIAASLK